MSDSVTARRRFRRGVMVAAGLTLVVAGVTACGPGWWTAMETAEPSSEIVATSDVIATPEVTEDLGPAPALPVTVTEFPTLWNEMAQANGLSDTLPDPLVADDTIDGISSVTAPVGDGTVFIQWQDEDGKVLSVSVDLTVDGEATTSNAVPVLEALVRAGLGLPAADASAFVATTLQDAVANAIDPSFIDWIASSDAGGDLGVSIVAGLGSFMLNPHVDDGLGGEVSDAASDAASPTS